MIDRRGNQLGEVLVCLHAGTIQRRGRATRSIDHDTHGHRLGQNKAQTGFKGDVLLNGKKQKARPRGGKGVLYVCVVLRRKKQKARPKGGKPNGTLESESRNAIL